MKEQLINQLKMDCLVFEKYKTIFQKQGEHESAEKFAFMAYEIQQLFIKNGIDLSFITQQNINDCI